MASKSFGLAVMFCLALTAAGFGLRAWNLGAADITNDEDLNLALAGKSLPEVVQFVSPRPPLAFIVQRMFSAATGTHDIWTIRLSSVLEGAAGMAAMFLLAYRVFGAWPAVLSTALLSFSYFHFVECRLARYYPLLMLSSLLFLVLFLELMENRRLWAFPLMLLAGVSAAATHQSAALFLLACGLSAPAFLTARPWRETFKENKRLVAGMSIAAVAGLAVCAILLRGQVASLLRMVSAGTGEGRRTLDFDVSPGFLLDFFREYAGVPGWMIVPCLLLFSAGFFYVCLNRWRFAVLSALALLVPFAAVYVVNPVGQWRSKYFIYMLPILLLLEALGVWCAAAWTAWGAGRFPKLVKPAVSVALIALVAVPNLLAMVKDLRHPPQTYQQVAHLLTEWVQPGDKIVYTQKWRHQREDKPWDLWVIMHNYFSTDATGTTASYAGTVDELGWSAAAGPRLWYLQGGQWHASDEVSRFFFSNKLSRVAFNAIILGYGPNTQGILFGANTGPSGQEGLVAPGHGAVSLDVMFPREGDRMVLIETKGPAPDELTLSVSEMARIVLNKISANTCGGEAHVPFGRATITLANPGEEDVAVRAMRIVPRLESDPLEIPAWDFYELSGGVNWQSMFSQATPDGVLMRGMRGWVEARYYFYSDANCDVTIALSAVNDAPGAHEYDVDVANKTNKREVLTFDLENDELSTCESGVQHVAKGLNLLRVRYHGEGNAPAVKTPATMRVNGISKIEVQLKTNGK